MEWQEKKTSFRVCLYGTIYIISYLWFCCLYEVLHGKSVILRTGNHNAPQRNNNPKTVWDYILVVNRSTDSTLASILFLSIHTNKKKCGFVIVNQLLFDYFVCNSFFSIKKESYIGKMVGIVFSLHKSLIQSNVIGYQWISIGFDLLTTNLNLIYAKQKNDTFKDNSLLGKKRKNRLFYVFIIPLFSILKRSKNDMIVPFLFMFHLNLLGWK